MGMAGGWIEGAGVGALCCNTMLPDNTSFVFSLLALLCQGSTGSGNLISEAAQTQQASCRP